MSEAGAALAVLFSPRIVRFLKLVFDDVPVLFQSLTFERGSQQEMHQDPGFVVVESPLEFAAAWIALEDIRPGSGELMYIDGSHRLPEYLFSGKYEHWNAKRDGPSEEAEWHRHIYESADRMGLERKTFTPSKGDALLWSADLAHDGSPVCGPLTQPQEPRRPPLPKLGAPLLVPARARQAGKGPLRRQPLRQPPLPGGRVSL